MIRLPFAVRPVSVIDRKESGSRMKLKTRLIIGFFVILFVPFLMFAVAFRIFQISDAYDRAELRRADVT